MSFKSSNFLKSCLNDDASGDEVPQWYERSTPTGEVMYTMERTEATVYHLAGPPDRAPTPGELLQALQANPKASLSDCGVLLFEEDLKCTNDRAVDLPSGHYTYGKPSYPRPARLEPLELLHDSYVRVSELYDGVASDLRRFLDSEGVYRSLGFQYRRGFLFYGPPGNGKTSLIRGLIQCELPADAVTIFLSSVPTRAILRGLRALPGRLKVFVFEELGTALESSNLDRFLSFLDGEDSIDRCLILATTNYPEKLPGNIVDRPSRFDRLVKVGDPTPSVRKELLGRLFAREIRPEELRATEGLSTAGLKELKLLVEVQGESLEHAARILHSYRKRAKEEFADLRPIGLSARSSDSDEE